MAEVELKIKGYKCNKCGHEWKHRPGSGNNRPLICPKCKSARWDKELKNKDKYVWVEE